MSKVNCPTCGGPAYYDTDTNQYERRDFNAQQHIITVGKLHLACNWLDELSRIIGANNGYIELEYVKNFVTEIREQYPHGRSY